MPKTAFLIRVSLPNRGNSRVTDEGSLQVFHCIESSPEKKVCGALLHVQFLLTEQTTLLGEKVQ